MRKFLVLLIVVAAFASGQTLRWGYQYAGQYGVYDDVRGMFQTPGGSLLLAGPGQHNQYYGSLLVEVSAGGVQTWDGFIDSLSFRALARGGGNRAYVAGARRIGSSREEATIVAHSIGGVPEWEFRYENPVTVCTDEFAAAVEAAGGVVYAAGTVTNNTTGKDIGVWTLSNSGGVIDAAWYDGPAHLNDEVRGAALSPGGQLYVLGSTVVNSKTVGMIIKLGGWVAYYNGHGLNTSLHRIKVNPAGGVYLIGEAEVSSSNSDIVVIKEDELSGTADWIREFDGEGTGDEAWDVDFDAQGNAYVVGAMKMSSTGYDIVVISLTNAGEERWVRRFSNSGVDRGAAIDVGEDGNVYAFGVTRGTSGTDDMFAVSLTPDNAVRWTYGYDSPGRAERVNPFCGLYGSDGNLYFAGAHTDDEWEDDMLLVSLNPATGVEEGERPTANGSRPAATIARGVLYFGAGHDPIPAGELGLCPKPALLDVTGRKVLELHPGANDISSLAPGAYLLRDGDRTSRVLVVR